MIVLLALSACNPRPGGPPSVNADPAFPALPGVDDTIVQVMDRDAIAGLSACLMVDGAVAWCSGYGERNPDTGDPAYASTPFFLASASKAVTAVAILQAVEEGAVDLDADVNDVLPFDVVHPDTPGQPITLRQLMAHTSGIADNWDALEPHYVAGDSPESLGGFLEGYLTPGGPDYSATENFLESGVAGATEYSNIGVALAAYVVEVATETPFDARCDARIFAPLGMNAGWHLADFDPDDVAMPAPFEGGAFATVPHYGVPDYPDGQLRADAPSMARFLAMLEGGGGSDGGQIVTQASIDEALTPAFEDLDEDQGLILYWWPLDGEDVWGHNGAETGASTEILVRESDGVGVVVLMNNAGTDDTLPDIERALLDAAPDL